MIHTVHITVCVVFLIILDGKYEYIGTFINSYTYYIQVIVNSYVPGAGGQH